MNIEIIAELVEDLEKHERRPSRKMDARIGAALDLPLDEGDEVPAYTSSIDAAVRLIPSGWWWHVSHLEAEVMPNEPCPGVPADNAQDYRFNGAPLGYSAMLMGSRALIPSAVCLAVLRARLSLLLKAAAVRDGRMYLVQTGSGPWIADVDGRLKEMPARAWLSAEGKLIAHKDAFPQYSFAKPEEDVEDDYLRECDRFSEAIDTASEKIRTMPGVSAVAADYERRLAVVVASRGQAYRVEFFLSGSDIACSLSPCGGDSPGESLAVGAPDVVRARLGELCA